MESSNDYLRVTGKRKTKVWITDEILDLMVERREWKNKNLKEYRRIHKLIQKQIKVAKEKWWREKCEEIEELDAKFDSFNMHKKIKEMTGMKGKKQPNILSDGTKIIFETKDKLRLWEDYIKYLFEDNERSLYNEPATAESGPEILDAEVRKGINEAKEGKAPGPDDIHSEVLKLINDENLRTITRLFNVIYDTGHIPKEWLKSTFVIIPKKPNAKLCKDYRTISLMSSVLKLFLKILHKRIYKKCEEYISETQFGFRNGLGTRDALFGLQVLVQRCMDINKDVHIAFIDYEKAFDRIKHQKMMHVLRKVGVDDKDIKIIANLYWHQTANVRVENETTDDIEIKRGVRQGCVLSPILFNLYSEEILAEALNESQEGIRINGEIINNIRYADDTVLLADSIGDLQALLFKVHSTSKNMGLNMNISKTKYMIISKTPPSNNLQILLDKRTIEQVHQYKYLGCWVNDKWDISQEIKVRIETARSAFCKMRPVLSNRNINLKLRVRIAQCYVFSVLLYGVEGWTLTKKLSSKLEAFEMWVYRRILKISWTERVRNTEVSERIGKQAEILHKVKTRKLQYFAHVMRNEKYRILQLVMQGKIVGKRRPGKRKTSWLKNLREWYGKNTGDLFRAAASKIRIAMMIANLR